MSTSCLHPLPTAPSSRVTQMMTREQLQTRAHCYGAVHEPRQKLVAESAWISILRYARVPESRPQIVFGQANTSASSPNVALTRIIKGHQLAPAGIRTGKSESTACFRLANKRAEPSHLPTPKAQKTKKAAGTDDGTTIHVQETR